MRFLNEKTLNRVIIVLFMFATVLNEYPWIAKFASVVLIASSLWILFNEKKKTWEKVLYVLLMGAGLYVLITA